MVELCASRISGGSFIALCMTCKELHFLGTKIFKERVDLVHEWVKEALACSKDEPQRYSTILKWLLGQAIKIWGITALPTKLDLQGALMHTNPADLAARIVISVGAQLTDDFIFAASSSFVLGRRSAEWVRLHKQLGLATGLSPALEDLCLNERPLSGQQLQQLSAEESYHYLMVALTNPDLSANHCSSFLAPWEAVQGWSHQQVYTSLEMLVGTGSEHHEHEDFDDDFQECLEVLLSLPAAAHLSLDEVLGLLNKADMLPYYKMQVGTELLLQRVVSFGQQLTAHAVEVGCKALLTRVSTMRLLPIARCHAPLKHTSSTAAQW